MIQRHSTHTMVAVGHDSTNRAFLDQQLEAYWRLDQSPCGVSEFMVLVLKGPLHCKRCFQPT